MSDSIWTELCLERREVFHQQRCQESILSEREQILLVQGVDIRLGVFVDDSVGDEDWATFIRSPNTIEGETTGETGYRAEQAFERFG